ncbi:MAG: hypothetical protein ACR2QJ_13775 [Geminicoccaceae bacterium]
MTADEAGSGFKVRALSKLAIRCAGHESMTDRLPPGADLRVDRLTQDFCD